MTLEDLRIHYTCMHVKEPEVILNMLLFGTKHGVLMLNGMVTLDEQNSDIII